MYVLISLHLQVPVQLCCTYHCCMCLVSILCVDAISYDFCDQVMSRFRVSGAVGLQILIQHKLSGKQKHCSREKRGDPWEGGLPVYHMLMMDSYSVSCLVSSAYL